MISIFAHTSESYAQEIARILGKGKRHALLIYREWFREGVIQAQDPAFNNAQKLLKEILALTDFSLPEVLGKLDENQTGKILLKTHDDLEIESVVLPMKAGWTLCLSSQIGCKMGCAFCETAKMGLIRNLSVSEIVSQLFVAKLRFKVDIRNLVFMGMGEPLDNREALFHAIRIFTDPKGFHLGPKHITISTSGLVKGIYDLMDQNLGVHLAVSVNAPTDEIRSRLMPVNKQHNMKELHEAMSSFCRAFSAKIFVEYVMIEGKNDRPEDALALATYLQGLDVTVNLIPYNPQRRGVFATPSEQVIHEFSRILQEKGFLTFVRQTFGQRIMAACGQLGNRKLLSLKRTNKMDGILSQTPSTAD